MEIEQTRYDEIASLIHSDASPVGIDAKKTHILILDALDKLAIRMDGIESKLAELDNKLSAAD